MNNAVKYRWFWNAEYLDQINILKSYIFRPKCKEIVQELKQYFVVFIMLLSEINYIKLSYPNLSIDLLLSIIYYYFIIVN